ncbi:ABC-2 family transporter protein [Oscillatoria amoena NRMC-F 0135]|nr:ABC-2 family transporter protein [Oscillatoria amoena NRMC-F 0135]
MKVFNLGLQNTLVYRWNFFIRLLMSFLPLLGLVYFWQAIYAARGGESVNGYTYGDMIFYFLMVNLVQALTMPLDDEWQISNEIKDGQLNQFLLKPIDYFVYRALLFASNRVVYTAVAFLPTLALFCFFSGNISPRPSTDRHGS